MASTFYLPLFGRPSITGPTPTQLSVHQFLSHQFLVVALFSQTAWTFWPEKAFHCNPLPLNIIPAPIALVVCPAQWLLIRYHLRRSFKFLSVGFISHSVSQSPTSDIYSGQFNVVGLPCAWQGVVQHLLPTRCQQQHSPPHQHLRPYHQLWKPTCFQALSNVPQGPNHPPLKTTEQGCKPFNLRDCILPFCLLHSQHQCLAYRNSVNY